MRRRGVRVTALVVGLAVAVLLLGIVVAGLLRGHAEILRALHALGVDLDPDNPAPGRQVGVALPRRPTPERPLATDVADLVGVTPGGDALSLAVREVPHDTLVAFLTSGCATCAGFWEAFRGGAVEVPGGARLVVATRGPEAESPGAVASLAGPVPVVMSSQAWEGYDVPFAPYFVYVSGPAGRVVGEGAASRWEEVAALVANAVADGTTSGDPRRSKADRARDVEVDRVLAEAGILPGDPRLHPGGLGPEAAQP